MQGQVEENCVRFIFFTSTSPVFYILVCWKIVVPCLYPQISVQVFLLIDEVVLHNS